MKGVGSLWALTQLFYTHLQCKDYQDSEGLSHKLKLAMAGSASDSWAMEEDH